MIWLANRLSTKNNFCFERRAPHGPGLQPTGHVSAPDRATPEHDRPAGKDYRVVPQASQAKGHESFRLVFVRTWAEPVFDFDLTDAIVG